MVLPRAVLVLQNPYTFSFDPKAIPGCGAGRQVSLQFQAAKSIKESNCDESLSKELIRGSRTVPG
jgi:hypothetical protein